MANLYPLIFNPIFKERIWGGRKLETFYGKSLPPGVPIGESWEISDRPGDANVIANGTLRGKCLRWLMENSAGALLGPREPMPDRFPLLIKIIDARETLSLQVHPPATLAAKLGGEPKTEMWYVAEAGPRAELFAGLKKGVTRAEFEQRLAAQTVAECFHRLPVKKGDALFLPSGRVHALGGETVVFEVQQNSDTTYRVFDWNRLDSKGKPRDLHVPQSLASIDFADFEPPLLSGQQIPAAPGTGRILVNDKLFSVTLRTLPDRETWNFPAHQMRVVALLKGEVLIASKTESFALNAGQFCLVPADCEPTVLRSSQPSEFLEIAVGEG